MPLLHELSSWPINSDRMEGLHIKPTQLRPEVCRLQQIILPKFRTLDEIASMTRQQADREEDRLYLPPFVDEIVELAATSETAQRITLASGETITTDVFVVNALMGKGLTYVASCVEFALVGELPRLAGPH